MPTSPELHDDAWNQKAEAQRVWKGKHKERSTSGIHVELVAGSSTGFASVPAEFQIEPVEVTCENEVDETTSSVMTAGEKVDPAALPGKWPAEHLAVRQASFGPKPSTNEHNSPLVGDQTGRPSDQPAESGTHDQHEDEVSLPSTKDSLQKNAVQDHKYSGKAQAQYGRTADRMVEGTLQNPDSGTSAFQQQFQNIDIAGRSKVHFGNIINNFSPDIFGGLHALQLDSIDDVAARYRESRASVQVRSWMTIKQPGV